MFYFRGKDSKGREFTIMDADAAISLGVFSQIWPAVLIALFLAFVSWLTGVSFYGMFIVFGVCCVLALCFHFLEKFNKLTRAHVINAIPLFCFSTILGQLYQTNLVDSHKESPPGYSIDMLLRKIALPGQETNGMLAKAILILLAVSTVLFIIAFILSPKIGLSGVITNIAVAGACQIAVAVLFFSLKSKMKASIFLGVMAIVCLVVEVAACVLLFAKSKKRAGSE